MEADSSDDSLQLIAYRSGTQENRFLAAVKLVDSGSDDAAMDGTNDDMDGDGKTSAVYKHHMGGGVAQLEVDEEDEITFRLSGSKVAPISIDVENEAPEFSDFAPEHESAFDDGDVDYTFTVIDPVSGIPEPEDLPDGDGDGDYMPLVALVSNGQCWTEQPVDDNKKPMGGYTMHDFAGKQPLVQERACDSADNR